MPVLIILLAAAAVILFALVVSTYRLKAPPMPSSPEVREAVCKIIKKYLNQGSIADLGSGWGGLARKIAGKFPDNHVRGVEGSLFPFLFCWISRLMRKGKSPEFMFRNFMKPKILRRIISDTDIFLSYLSPIHMLRLKELLTIFEESGSMNKYYISIVFAFPGLAPVEVIEVNDTLRSRILVYKISRYV